MQGKIGKAQYNDSYIGIIILIPFYLLVGLLLSNLFLFVGIPKSLILVVTIIAGVGYSMLALTVKRLRDLNEPLSKLLYYFLITPFLLVLSFLGATSLTKLSRESGELGN